MWSPPEMCPCRPKVTGLVNEDVYLTQAGAVVMETISVSVSHKGSTKIKNRKHVPAPGWPLSEKAPPGWSVHDECP